MKPGTIDTVPAVADAAAAPATADPQPVRKPSGLRLVLAANRTALAPWGWMAAADVTAFTAHYASPTPVWSFVTAAGASAAVTAGTLWRTRDTRLQKTIKTARTRRKVQKNAQLALITGSLWELLAATWTPVGPHAAMQLALLGGGLAVAAPHLYRNRRRAPIDEPLAQIEAPAEDPRLTRFRDQFCQVGVLKDSLLHDLEDVPGGFKFYVELSLAHRGTIRDVQALEDEIAKLFDVPPDQVTVVPPEGRSARRAVVTILTAARAREREEAWDGDSTYDPTTGTFELGGYDDASRSKWQLHVPYSGACGGLSVGVIGSGKTGTLHTVCCEAGQAKLCSECLAERSCPACDMRRICALWMGDPQRQPFGVWRGRADLTAWGPLSCVRMLSWMHAGMRNRADFFGRMAWTDHLGRENFGKGWFDPSPQFPMVLGVIDEWPIIIQDPVLAPYAIQLAADIGAEGRKVGVALLAGSQEADVEKLGGREIREALTAFNACVHHCDRLARQMIGIEGNPAELPPGVPGASYLKGYDRRSGIGQRTKSIREYLRPGETGVDVRAIAERIASDPITYDEAILRAIGPLGYTGPGQILDDETDGWDITSLHPADETTEPDPEANEPARPAGGGTVSTADTATVRSALEQRPDADVWDLMEATGLSALDVSRALDTLITQGHAAQEPSGRYAPCH